MTYRQACAALEARQETKIELGLARVLRHLGRLGNPQDRAKAFHVAGTNGKGSTCAMLASVLSAAGYKTGLYISPHLVDVRERIQIAGRSISKDQFASAIERTLAVESADAKLTYFELLTVAAFIFFADQKCDVIVLETGLGGRLDATNVVKKPLATIITSIGYDHMAYLGKTLGKIAGEKAGIAKKGVPLICPKLPAAAMAAVRVSAKRAGARLQVISRPWPRTKVNWSTGQQGFTAPFGAVNVGILGETQGMNAALVYYALKAAAQGIHVSDSAWRRGFQRVAWPCRFSVRRFGAKTAIFDGAHNPEAMANLAKTFRSSPWSKRRALWIMGVLKDKDVPAMIAPIVPFIKEAVAVAPASPRALPAGELAKILRRAAPAARVFVDDDADTAFSLWRRARSAPSTAVVCGSFYLVGRAARLGGARG
jgi:dihydrofolate synthase/folylpolyglutamate synthase